MSALTDLISQIENPELRARIQAEIDRANKQKKFGLVFEEHLPESTPLYDVPIKVGGFVSTREKSSNGFVLMKVLAITDDTVECITQAKETVSYPIDDLVTVAPFGEPIYPYLKPIDSVCNAPDSDLWHTLIEADNYHALQLLEYMYAGKVDCIYIDPPYNKPDSHDWKYNCDYVDSTDSYRHSKWLSMMEKRLKLAKKLLNPKDSALIVTIDELEYHHLACLLEQLFPEANIQMVSITINPSGAVRKNMFARSDEYAFYVFLGDCKICQEKGSGPVEEVRWWYLRRLEYTSRREAGRPLQFYPIYIDNNDLTIKKIGEPLKEGESRFDVPQLEGCTALFPVRDDGLEMVWGVTGETLKRLYTDRVVQIIKNPNSPFMPYSIKYLSENYKEKIEQGRWDIVGEREDGSKIVVETGGKLTRANSVWRDKRFETKTHGTILLKNIIGANRFSFPKSLYAVHDAIRYIVGEKPDALVLDFFAGSGTTMHAINLMNKEDNGHRRCITVTNNEIGETKEKELKKNSIYPGNDEWEKWGIARYVNWPRTKCSILGIDVEGNPIPGNYYSTGTNELETPRKWIQLEFNGSLFSLKQKKSVISLINGQQTVKLPTLNEDMPFVIPEDSDCNASILFDINEYETWISYLEGNKIVTDLYVVTHDSKAFRKIKSEGIIRLGSVKTQVPICIPMSDGFKSNAVYFKLGFLDKRTVALGHQFRELLPVLWMKAGAIGPCPKVEEDILPDWLILTQNKMAILLDETAFPAFEELMREQPDIRTLYLVTDSEKEFVAMSAALGIKDSYQIYRDYLDNFRINRNR